MTTHFSGAGDLPTHMTLIWADSGTRIGVQVVCLGGDLKALRGGVWASGEKSGYLSFSPCFFLVGSCDGDIGQPALPAPSVPECSTPVAKDAPRQGDGADPTCRGAVTGGPQEWVERLQEGIDSISPQPLSLPQATGMAKLWTGNRGWRQPQTKSQGLRKDLSQFSTPGAGLR